MQRLIPILLLLPLFTLFYTVHAHWRLARPDAQASYQAPTFTDFHEASRKETKLQHWLKYLDGLDQNTREMATDKGSIFRPFIGSISSSEQHSDNRKLTTRSFEFQVYSTENSSSVDLFVDGLVIGKVPLLPPIRSAFVSKDDYAVLMNRPRLPSTLTATFHSLKLLNELEYVGAGAYLFRSDLSEESGSMISGLASVGWNPTAAKRLALLQEEGGFHTYEGAATSLEQAEDQDLESYIGSVTIALNLNRSSGRGAIDIPEIGIIQLVASNVTEEDEFLVLEGEATLDGVDAGSYRIILYGDEAEEVGGTYHLGNAKRSFFGVFGASQP